MLRRHAQGLTLIEMAVALVILSITLMMAAPAFQDWIQSTRIRSAAEGAQAGLQLARSEAIRRNTNVEFVLNADLKSGWTVRTAAPIANIQSRPAGEGSSGIVLATTPGGALAVTFDGLGRALAANLDGSARTEQIDITGLQISNRPLRVTIGIGGQVRLCDPAISDTTDLRGCQP